MSQRSNESTSSGDSEMNEDYQFWSRGIDRHCLGEYSFAVIKGNTIMEDYSEVVVGRDFTFVGVYDGHGGHQTSEYLSQHMFNNLLSCIEERSTLSKEVLKEAFLKTEANWVAKQCKGGQELISAPGSSSGSSCLLGIIWKASLYVANVGNSRAIMVQRDSTNITIQPLTRDDNVKNPEVRAEVQALHPDEPDFVVKTKGRYSIKGKTELSKSMGDLHLKYTEFSIMGQKTYMLNNPAVTSEPSPVELPIEPFIDEKFVIFASHGFWRLMDMEEAARIVVELPWKGIAAILIKRALDKAATKIGKTYEDVLNTKDNRGMKLYHDDITVVVLFFYKNLDLKDIQEQMSVKVGGSFALEKIWQG